MRFSRLIRQISPIRPIRHIGPRLRRAVYWVLLVSIVVTGTGIYYLFGRSVGSVEAVWFDDFWAYRQKLPISTHTASETNVYNEITVDTASLTTDKLQADCDDLRFTKQNGELLPYNIVSGCDGASTTIRVGFDTMPIAPFDIWMYYGNPSATAGSVILPHSACGNGCAEGAFASEEKAPSPAAYWKFDDGTGTNAQDSSQNNNDGTISGASWQTEDQCVAGKCLRFDGTNDTANTATTLNVKTNIITVSFWLKWLAYASDNDMAMELSSNANDNDGTFVINPNNGDGTFSVAIQDGSSPNLYRQETFTRPSANAWHAYSFVFDNSTSAGDIKAYVDGVEKTTTIALNTKNQTNNFRNDTLYFMSRGGASLFGSGFMDEVKIHPFALTAAQVNANYSARSQNEGASSIVATEDNQFNTLNNGLVAHWKMDQTSWNGTSGEVVDSSGNGNNGTRVSGATTTGAGKFGYAGTFNGSSDYVNTSDINALDGISKMTLSSWFKAPSLAVNKTLIGKWTYSSQGSFLIQTDNTLSDEFRIFITSSLTDDGQNYAITDGANITANNWYHISVVYDGTQTGNANRLKAYVNGVQVGMSYAGTISAALTSASSAVRIGAFENLSRYWNGQIDDTRIYNRALLPDETALLAKFAPGPVGYYKLDEKTGQSGSDVSVNGNSMTLGASGSVGSDDPTWVSAKYGGGLKFDGTDDIAQIADNTTIDNITGDMTVSLWVKPESTHVTNAAILSKGTTGAAGWMLEASTANTNTYYFSWGTGSAYQCSGTTITLTANAWQYLSFSKSGTTVTYYQNGVKTGSCTGSSATIAANNDVLYLGRWSSGGGRFWNGQLDDLKIYNYARDTKQVGEDMNAGHPAVGSPVASAIAHWKFDEGADNTCSGGANDTCNSGSAGATLDGTGNTFASPSSATSGWSHEGKFGKALNFDGSSDYISVADSSVLDITGTITLSIWARPTSLTNNVIIAKRDAATNNNYQLGFLSDGTIQFCPSISVCHASTATLTANTWQHVVVTYDTAFVRFYKDGKLITSTASTTAMVANSLALNIGSYASGAGSFFPGRLDEIKIYNYQLTPSEVAIDYNRGQTQVLGSLSDNSSYEKQAANQEYCVPGDTSTCTAPVLRLDFEEKTGNTAYDRSGNGYNGNLGSSAGADSADPTWKPGKFGAGMKFDNSDDLIDFDTPTGLNFNQQDFTLQTWIKHGSGEGGALIGKQNEAGDLRHYLITVNTQIALEVRTNSAFGGAVVCDNVSTSTNMDNNTWRHVAFVLDDTGSGTTCYLYIDGKLESTDTSANRIASDNSQFYVGNSENPSNPYGGSMDEVRVYNYVRSASQVAWDYSKGAPVAWYKMDECQGTTVNDSVSTAINGTLSVGSGGSEATVGTCGTSSTAWGNGASGKRNYSVDLDGTDDAVSITDSSNSKLDLSTMTLSAWVYITATSADRMIMHKTNAYGLNFGYTAGGVGGATGKIGFHRFVTSAWSTVNSASDQPLNQWVHVVGTWDGSTSKMYINGRLEASVSNSTATGTNDNALTLGYASTNGMDGQLDDVRIYNHALTATQVRDMYNGGAVNFAPSTGAP